MVIIDRRDRMVEKRAQRGAKRRYRLLSTSGGSDLRLQNGADVIMHLQGTSIGPMLMIFLSYLTTGATGAVVLFLALVCFRRGGGSMT
jgi:hypothetical protein